MLDMTDPWTYGSTDQWTDELTDRLMNGQTDGQLSTHPVIDDTSKT